MHMATNNAPTANAWVTTLHSRGVGYAYQFNTLQEVLEKANSEKYPPYNIRAINKDHYIVEVALAGFDKRALTVEVQEQVLKISGEGINTTLSPSEFDYVHQGIARRDFEHVFPLAEYVEVTEAQFEDGLLTVTLRRELPEEKKEKIITIK
jgi:molecular chaperone IbpA